VGVDVRIPIGLLFLILGALLVVYGALADEDPRSLGININLWWGLTMLVFGGLMALWGCRRGGRTPEREGEPPDPPPRP